MAHDRLAPARIGFGRGEARIGINRRLTRPDGKTYIAANPERPIDEEVGVIRVDTEAGGPLAALVNYACHPTTLSFNYYCGDYPGWTQLALEPLAEPDASWEPVHSFPAQTPASAGLGARGTPFSQTLSILERLREECRVLLVARSRGQVDRLLALLREHDVPAAEWTTASWTTSTATRAPFYVLHGDLSIGFLSSELRLAVLTEEELFAKAKSPIAGGSGNRAADLLSTRRLRPAIKARLTTTSAG